MNKEELVMDMKVRGSLGCRDQKMVDFWILRGGNRAKEGTQPGISGKQTSVTSGICLGSYPMGFVPGEEEWSRTAG